MSFRRNSLGGKKKKEGIPWQSSDLDSVLTTKAVQSWVRELQTPVCVVWQKKKKKNFRKYIPQKRYNNKLWEDECQEKRKFLSVNTQSILRDTKVSPLEFTCFSLAKNSLVSLENYNTSHVH